MESILVSSCLLGINCRYNGGHNQNEALMSGMAQFNLIPVCPEQLGGLPTPRLPCEIRFEEGERRVFDINQEDRTDLFVKGAEETLKIAKLLGITKAILKQNSPSCGSRYCYDGSFSKILIPAMGITAQLLDKHQVALFDEDTWHGIVDTD